MKHILPSLILPLLASAQIMAGQAADDPYGSPRIFWDVASETTVFAPGNGYTGYARMIQLADGRLMAVCENRGIKIAFSSDKGATWSEEKHIATNPAGISECVPDLLQLSDSTIIVGYNPRPSTPYSTDRHFGIRARMSHDNGQSWSDEIFIYDASHDGADGCWEPHFLQLPSGEIHCYFADESPYTSSNEQQISVCRSFDGGHTWSRPDCVSFRPGCRDGMPAAILLEDPDEIVVIAEDNGWYGNMGNFTPTTVRCPLSVNWHDYHVGGPDDTNRNMIYTFSPDRNMAAPYIRRLASGITVASCQGLYQRSGDRLDMWVAVGDDRARNFKSLSRPFALPENKSAMWNSLAVIDDSIVAAVSGIDGGIRMIKGYPIAEASIPYAGQSGCILPMGVSSRVPATVTMSYDEKYLYFTADVADTDITDKDCITLLLDPDDLRTARLSVGLYRLIFRPDGSVMLSHSLGRAWSGGVAMEQGCCAASTDSGGYRIDAAIPWTALDTEGITSGRKIRLAVEITAASSDGSSIADVMTDVNNIRSETWLPARLLPHDSQAAIAPVNSDSVTASDFVYTLSGTLLGRYSAVSSSLTSGLYIIAGRKTFIK